MSNELKTLSKLLERYDNSAEDFYFQQKRYYHTGIVANVTIPFTVEEVSANPSRAIKHILQYSLVCFSGNELSQAQLISLMYEMPPSLFEGDEVQVGILSYQETQKVPPQTLFMDGDPNKLNSYTIKVTLKKMDL